MPLPFAIPAAVKAVPWGLVLKAGVVVVALLVGVGVGCSCQADRDQAKVDREVARTAEANTRATRLQLQGQGLADQLRAITERTKAAKAAADERARSAKAQADLAEKETEAARHRASKAEADLDRAKRNPDCRKLLETKSCAAFR